MVLVGDVVSVLRTPSKTAAFIFLLVDSEKLNSKKQKQKQKTIFSILKGLNRIMTELS